MNLDILPPPDPAPLQDRVRPGDVVRYQSVAPEGPSEYYLILAPSGCDHYLFSKHFSEQTRVFDLRRNVVTHLTQEDFKHRVEEIVPAKVVIG